MQTQLTRLSNGFRVVTERMDGLKSASLGIWIGAGGRHERLDQNGVAHFLEHMAFKGTATRSALQIAESIEGLGGHMNAYTSKEVTAYWVRVLEDDALTALDVVADIVLNPAFDPEELETERGVILQEIGQMMDTPEDLVFEWLQKTAYPDQPMGWSILGPAENVGAFCSEDLRKFVDERYRPGSMVLAAAGAIDHDSIVAFAERVFGPIPGGSVKPVETAVFRSGEHRKVKDLEQAQFALALEGHPLTDPDIYVGLVYATIIGGGMSSRLFQTVREQHGLCYAIGAQAACYSDTGSITIYAGTGEKDVASLATLCIDELRRVPEDLTEDEVIRARIQLKAGMLMGLENAHSRSERIARMILNWDRIVELDEITAGIDAVTRDRVAEFATSLRRNGDPVLSLYGPVAEAPGLPELRDRLVA